MSMGGSCSSPTPPSISTHSAQSSSIRRRSSRPSEPSSSSTHPSWSCLGTRQASSRSAGAGVQRSLFREGTGSTCESSTPPTPTSTDGHSLALPVLSSLKTKVRPRSSVGSLLSRSPIQEMSKTVVISHPRPLRPRQASSSSHRSPQQALTILPLPPLRHLRPSNAPSEVESRNALSPTLFTLKRPASFNDQVSPRTDEFGARLSGTFSGGMSSRESNGSMAVGRNKLVKKRKEGLDENWQWIGRR